MTAKVERLRDFVGLDSCNLLRIVGQAAAICKAKLQSGKKASPEMVHKWLLANVRWGASHTPNEETVKRHMANWEVLEKNPRVVDVVENALQRFGRGNLFDYPTKLQQLTNKGEPLLITWLAESLYTTMRRKSEKDPMASANSHK